MGPRAAVRRAVWWPGSLLVRRTSGFLGEGDAVRTWPQGGDAGEDPRGGGEGVPPAGLSCGRGGQGDGGGGADGGRLLFPLRLEAGAPRRGADVRGGGDRPAA